jgi:hypothetical protein
MHVTAGIFLLRVVDILVEVARHGPIAAGRVGVEPIARLHCQVGGLLHRLHREISGRLEHDCSLAADPRDNGWPVFVIVAPPGLTFLPTATRAAPQRLLATTWRLPLAARGVIEGIRFHRALQLMVGFVGHGRIPQPPAPARAGPAMAPQLSGDTPRRTRQAQQEGR